MINENDSNVILLPWRPKTARGKKTAKKTGDSTAYLSQRDLARMKAENIRLSSRVAKLEAIVSRADKVLSEAVSRAFAESRRCIPAISNINDRDRQSA